MERRYLTFFLVSFAVLLLWNSLFPPPPPVNRDQPAGGADGAIEEVDKQPAGRLALDADLPTLPPPELEVEEEEVDVPPFVTLGSVEPGGPYRLLATFNTRGATIHRVELSSRQYRDLHDRSGYLGQLEVADAASGALVQVVGPGTPAAEAKILPGDVITAIAGTGEARRRERDLSDADDLQRWLADTQPGETILLTVLREGVEQVLTARLIRRPLDLIRPEAENVLLHEKRLPEPYIHHPSLELQLRKVGPREVAQQDLAEANEALATGAWTTERPAENIVEFTKRLPRLGLEVVKRLKLVRVEDEERYVPQFRGYHLEFDVEIRNLFPEPQTVVYELQGPNGLPIEGWWYASKVGRGWSAYGLRDVILRFHGKPAQDLTCRSIADGDVAPQGDGASLAYVGVDVQYFAVALLPENLSVDAPLYNLVTPNVASTRVSNQAVQARYANASFLLTSRTIALSAAGGDGDRQLDSATLFAGPKRPELLRQYHAAGAPDYTLENFVYYGWFGNIGIPQLMVAILTSFYTVVKNYGVAIILLTVLVRSCMFPLSRKQAKNMMMMQELKPEIDRIAAKYKDDMQARSKAQQELFAKHNYNPMGGCLLMFIQLPIFIGLYRALMVDVELRQAPLIPGIRWCSNLAAPDMFLNWSGMWWQWFNNGEGMLALGPYLNILPLATVALFLVQQKMFMPPPTDDQTRMMQKMMKYMMIFMCFLFFRVAAGLCIYFIASSLWGIAERKLLPKPPKNDDASNAAATATAGRESSARRKRSSAQRRKTGKTRKR